MKTALPTTLLVLAWIATTSALEPGDIVRTIPLPLPYGTESVLTGLAVTGNKLYVAHACRGATCGVGDTGLISLLKASSGQVVTTFQLSYHPAGLALFVKKSLVAIDDAGILHSLDPKTGAEVVSFATGLPGPFWGLAADDHSLWLGIRDLTTL